MGIPESDYDNIFRGFYRTAVRDERRAVGGMGMGLAIARRLLENHQGQIAVESKPTLDDPRRREKMEGYLTTFTVKIPTDLKPGLRTIIKEDGK